MDVQEDQSFNDTLKRWRWREKKMLWDRTFQIIKVFHEKYFYNPLMGVIFYTSEFFTLTTRYGSDNKLQTFFLFYL